MAGVPRRPLAIIAFWKEGVMEEQNESLGLVPATPTVQVPDAWGAPSPYLQAALEKGVKRSQAQVRMTHGMYAGVPIVCKGKKQCPFGSTCYIPDDEMVFGARCPIEIAAVLERHQAYVEELQIEPTDYVDLGIVKQLVDVEIMMLRADNKLAASGDVFREVVDAINQRTGEVYYKLEIDPIFELKEKLRKEHTRLLNQLNATRKDKRDTLKGLSDPSSMAAGLMERLRQLEANGTIIDIDLADVSLVEEPQPQDEPSPPEESEE
jgi:hypothetical protein